MKWAQHVTSMRQEMHTEFWLEDKIQIGLVKVITATLQVVKCMEVVFYFFVRMHSIMFKGKYSLQETYLCKSENAISMLARWPIAVSRSLSTVDLSCSCACLSCSFSATSLEIVFSYSSMMMLNTTCKKVSDNLINIPHITTAIMPCLCTVHEINFFHFEQLTNTVWQLEIYFKSLYYEFIWKYILFKEFHATVQYK